MNDRDLLTKLLENDLREDERQAFADMKQNLVDGRYRTLTEKQREWAKRRLSDFEPDYENLVSAGKVPRGKEVEMLFKPGPLKPPGRG